MAVLFLGLGTLLIGAIVLVVATRFMKRLVFDPIEQLRTGAEQIGRGNLDYQIDFIRQDEIGQVAQAFNEMAGRLRDREALLMTRTAALEAEMLERRRTEEKLRQAEKMNAVGQLAAGIAHDFNNLLTIITGFAELLRYQLTSDSRSLELVDKILHSGQRAAELVRQLLTFSRKQTISPRVVDLNSVVKNIDWMLQRITNQDIELQTILAPDLWPVTLDPAQFEQVIINLAVNARDAMPHGGLLLLKTTNIRLDEKQVYPYLDLPPGEYVRLAISDTGIGMSAEIKDHIFEPFFTTKEVGKGTGLGLAVVFGMVKQSGGDIHVESQEGVGTTFEIYFPRAHSLLPSPARPPDLAAIPL
jgi:signal transduction histidine kinase